jgi:cytochrome P450
LGEVEIEETTSHVAADVIFRTLFSIPIEHSVARDVFSKFRDHQRSQPILNLAAFLPLPRWMPRFFKRETKETARDIRRLITKLTAERQVQIAEGSAPDDLATKNPRVCPKISARFLNSDCRAMSSARLCACTHLCR